MKTYLSEGSRIFSDGCYLILTNGRLVFDGQEGSLWDDEGETVDIEILDAANREYVRIVKDDGEDEL